MSVDDEVFRYTFNLFAFPEDYFEAKTAEDLHISEEARQILIADMKAYVERKRKYTENPEECHKQYVSAQKKKYEEFVNGLKGRKADAAGDSQSDDDKG